MPTLEERVTELEEKVARLSEKEGENKPPPPFILAPLGGRGNPVGVVVRGFQG
jgi:hypothetical protein